MAYICPSHVAAGAGRIAIIQAGYRFVNDDFWKSLIVGRPLADPGFNEINLGLV